MSNLQRGLAGTALLLAMVLVYEWRQAVKSEAGPAELIHDVNDHATGGALRAELEPYLEHRGGDVSYDSTVGSGRTSGVDHAIFRDIRHLGEAREDLKADFYYDQGDHLMYFTLRRTWNKPKP
jgi:hypothetical protein